MLDLLDLCNMTFDSSVKVSPLNSQILFLQISGCQYLALFTHFSLRLDTDVALRLAVLMPAKISALRLHTLANHNVGSATQQKIWLAVWAETAHIWIQTGP